MCTLDISRNNEMISENNRLNNSACNNEASSGTESIKPPRRKRPNSLPNTSLILFSLLLLLVNFGWFSNSGNAVAAQSLANSFFTEPDVQPGFSSRLSPRAFQLLADYLKQRVSKFLKFGALQFNSSVALTPLVQFHLASAPGASAINFDATGFQSKLNVVAGKEITWTGSNLRTTVRSSFKMISSNGEVVGNVPVTFDKTSVEIGLNTAINSDGHLKTDLERCRVLVGELHLEFTTADAEVLRNYLPLIHRAIRDQLDNLLCPTFHSELIPVIANRLFNTPMSAALFDHYFINYGLIGSVLYGADGSVEMRHRGNVFGILRQGRTRLNDFRLPFRSAPLLTSQLAEQKHMITFSFSNYTLASLLFWMDQYRKFDFEISKQSVNDSNIAGYLRTECGAKDICAGTLFPALAQSFSNGLVNIKTHTVTFPHVRFEHGKAFIVVDSRIDAFVSQPDKNRRFLTASMLAELVLTKPTFKDYTFKAQLVIDSFKISDVVSLVEGIDAGSIEFLINALNELIVADDILKKLKDGIKLPILLDFEQSSSEVHFEKDHMWVGADYCFDEQCKNVGQSQDMDVNYYDAAG
ncbi:hypothetical protein Ddc_07442 [Ditylenchus destructor]|nr:hypothetical protein Ddc_07442 [Ditylenchus destructor]